MTQVPQGRAQRWERSSFACCSVHNPTPNRLQLSRGRAEVQTTRSRCVILNDFVGGDSRSNNRQKSCAGWPRQCRQRREKGLSDCCDKSSCLSTRRDTTCCVPFCLSTTVFKHRLRSLKRTGIIWLTSMMTAGMLSTNKRPILYRAMKTRLKREEGGRRSSQG